MSPISARNMSADPGVARKIRPWCVRECHNCVIVPVAAAAVCILNTCSYSRQWGRNTDGHKMEKTGKRVGRGEGQLLLISCLCTDLLYQNTATSCVFDIHRQTQRTQVEERKAIFFSFIFTTLHLRQTLVVHNKLLTQPFYSFLLTPDFTFYICLVESYELSYKSCTLTAMTWTLVFFGTDL